MKKALVISLAILLIVGLTACASGRSKQGQVVNVAVSFSLDDMADGTIDHPVFGNTVTVETADGKQYNAVWDEQLLGRPVSMELSGLQVSIVPGDEPDLWKVTEIVSQP